MRIVWRVALAVALGLVSVACGAPRVDTSSDTRMGESVARMREALSDDRRKEFDDAYLAVAMQDVTVEKMLSGAVTPGSLTAEAKTRLNGKTADEIIAEARQLKEAAEAKAKEEARAEIAKLEQARAAVDAASQELAKFEIVEAKFRQESSAFGMPQPLIVLTVKNGTPHAISRAFFVGTLTSPGRSVPWLREDFNYSISGGLEAGEQVTWRLSPNAFGAWGTVKPAADAGLRVDVVRLEGADGKPLFTDAEFTESDAARLASLKKQFGL